VDPQEIERVRDFHPSVSAEAVLLAASEVIFRERNYTWVSSSVSPWLSAGLSRHLVFCLLYPR